MNGFRFPLTVVFAVLVASCIVVIAVFGWVILAEVSPRILSGPSAEEFSLFDRTREISEGMFQKKGVLLFVIVTAAAAIIAAIDKGIANEEELGVLFRSIRSAVFGAFVAVPIAILYGAALLVFDFFVGG